MVDAWCWSRPAGTANAEQIAVVKLHQTSQRNGIVLDSRAPYLPGDCIEGYTDPSATCELDFGSQRADTRCKGFGRHTTGDPPDSALYDFFFAVFERRMTSSAFLTTLSYAVFESLPRLRCCFARAFAFTA